MAPKTAATDPNDFTISDIVQDREDLVFANAHSGSDELPEVEHSSAHISDGESSSPNLANLWSSEQSEIGDIVETIRGLRADLQDPGTPTPNGLNDTAKQSDGSSDPASVVSGDPSTIPAVDLSASASNTGSNGNQPGVDDTDPV